MSNRGRLVTFLVIMAFLLPNTYGVTVIGNINNVGHKATYKAADDEIVVAKTTASAEGLSYKVTGSGDYEDSHWVSNNAGAYAEVSVDILNADSYDYSYELSPGKGVCKASDHPVVSARESLDVIEADYIKAYAKARNAEGYGIGVSTEVVSGSLEGYSNIAWASTDEVQASQWFDGASGDQIQTESTSLVSKSPLPARGPAHGLDKKMDQEAGVSTTVTCGVLSDYRESAQKSFELTDIKQAGHIEGYFTSTATVGTESKTREANYGTIYDLDMQARIEGNSPTVSGTLGYYVDDDNHIANKIQGAIDAAESSDTINVAPGKYCENVVIEESVDIAGSGADQTVVDGNQIGRCFHILSGLDVTIKGLTIQNGNADFGAGIWNEGTLTMQNCLVQNNNARIGAGIHNDAYASAMIKDSTICNNQATDGGALSNSGTSDSRGVLTLDSSSIYGNRAYMGGGAIHNVGGIININSGSIYQNKALFGGAIRTQADGEVNVNGGSIESNEAIGGGAIMNWGRGTVNLMGGTISNNYAHHGGGIYNTDGGEVNLYGGAITGNNVVYWGGGIYNLHTNVNPPSVINGDTSLVYLNTRSSGEENNICEEYQ